MPPVWSGTLTFGLVAIPVQMRSAVSSHKIAFRQIHRADHGRVRYRKVCELDGQQLDDEDIGRAYEAGRDQVVPIEDQELDEMPLPTAKTIEVNGFVPLAAVPPEMIGKPYYLAPQSPAANKPYVLMREALTRSGKAAVGKVAMRGTGERLILVRPHGDTLAAVTLHWPDELRAPDDAAPTRPVDLTDDELAAALDYIAATADFDMAGVHDEYAEALESLLDAKAQGAEPPPVPEPAPAGGVTDLIDALKAAAEQARARRKPGP